MSKAHTTAIKSFNLNHSTYDKYRLSFSKELTKKFLVDLKLASGSEYHTDKKILELAAGTGKFTRNLVEFGWGENLVAVEPSSGMLTTLKKNFPSIKTYEGSSYELPLPDSSFDSVVIAQGWHWFSDKASLKELYRVLKPNGTLGMIWNFDVARKESLVVRDSVLPEFTFLLDEGTLTPELLKKGKELAASLPNSQEKPYLLSHAILGDTWAAKTGDLAYGYDVNVPQYRHGNWRNVLSDHNEYFTSIEKETFLLHDAAIKKEDIYLYWETRSYITALSQEEKDKLKVKLNEALDKYVTDDDKVLINGEEYLHRIIGAHAITLTSKKQ